MRQGCLALISLLILVGQAHSQEKREGPIIVQTEYVRITTETADIHRKPNNSSEVAFQGREGEIFRIATWVGREEGDWYRLVADEWAGNTRFIHRSLVEKTDKPVLQLSGETRGKICLERDEARRRASAESPGFGFDDDYARSLLRDRYWIAIARKYSIQPAMDWSDLGCSEFFPGRSSPSRVPGVILPLMAIMAPFVGIGLLCVFGIVRRQALQDGREISTTTANWRVMGLAALYGTLISAIVIAIGTGVVFSLIPGAIGGAGIFPFIFGILGLFVVLSYVLAARLALR